VITYKRAAATERAVPVELARATRGSLATSAMAVGPIIMALLAKFVWRERGMKGRERKEQKDKGRKFREGV
jgi:hypothetical protein